MATKLGILSESVIKLGDAPLLSLSEDRVAVTVGLARYDGVVDSLLVKNHWVFARKRAPLSQLVADALDPWRHAYQLPGDRVLIIRTDPYGDFQIYGDTLQSNLEPLSIEYIYRPPESTWPAYFAELVVARLAAELALPVTGARSLRAEMMDEAELKMGDAYWADAQGTTPVAFLDNPLGDVRF